jgi:hypothetical protein
LFPELRVETVGALLGSGAGLSLALDQLDGAGNTFFEGGKIAAAESEISG